MNDNKLTGVVPGRARGRFLQAALPGVVLIATIGVLLWSAWPVLRKDRPVQATQAVFDRSTSEPTVQQASQTTQPSGPVVQAAGWLEAEPYITACTSLVDGIIEKVNVLEGDHVEKGEVVAELVREDEELRLRKAEADVVAAQSRLELAKADLAAAEASWKDPVELDRAVETNEASLAENKAELAQLPSLIASARAKLDRLEAEQKWLEQSVSSGAATELELIVAQKDVESQRAEVESLEARRPLLEARIHRHEAELRAARRDIELRIEDRRAVDTARARVGIAESELAAAQTRRDEAALALDRTTIKAPISGYVLRRLKIPGDKVIRMMDTPHSAHVLHLYDPDRLQVRVDVPLADASHIRMGQPCEIVVEVLPDRTFRGEVLIVTHEADLQKNTLEIKVKLLDPDPILKPEMLTRVRFLNNASAGGGGGTNASSHDSTTANVLIPEDAIDHAPTGDRVWVIANRKGTRGVLRAIEVEQVGSESGWLRITGKVQPGSLLAHIEPGFRDGMRVFVKEDES